MVSRVVDHALTIDHAIGQSILPLGKGLTIDHRGRRRQPVEDWTLLVYAFNLQLENKTISKLFYRNIWPRVAETTVDYNRRAGALKSRKSRDQEVDHGHDGKQVA